MCLNVKPVPIITSFKKRNYFNIPAAPKTPEVLGDFENDFSLVMLIKTQPV